MLKPLVIGTLCTLLASCGAEGAGSGDSTATSGAQASRGAPSLASGTRIEATIEKELSSRVNKSGEACARKSTAMSRTAAAAW